MERTDRELGGHSARVLTQHNIYSKISQLYSKLSSTLGRYASAIWGTVCLRIKTPCPNVRCVLRGDDGRRPEHGRNQGNPIFSSIDSSGHLQHLLPPFGGPGPRLDRLSFHMMVTTRVRQPAPCLMQSLRTQGAPERRAPSNA